jgi:two-component system response regulator GlrR
MSSATPPAFTGRYIIVADEDPAVVAFVIHTLRADGYAVFHAYDARSATELALALEHCDLVLSNTKVIGSDGVSLIRDLRDKRPRLPIIHIANIGRSTPELEARLPPGIPILREPFTAEQLRVAVTAVLDGRHPPAVASDRMR